MTNVKIYQGDCLAILPTLEACSVQTCITSPPYFGLRDYGTATWEGGGAECDHKQVRSIQSSTLRNDGRKNIGTQAYEKTAAIEVPYRDTCAKCGARRVDDQIGLESTPDEYVAKLVEVFREVRRVLRDDGTVFLNLGDSYVTQPAGNKKPSGFQQKSKAGRSGALAQFTPLGGQRAKPYGTSDKAPGDYQDGQLKPKDLIGIPWLVAFALRADGWYLRSDIIWHKPNPMPESVTDRPTKAHEYIFLLSKSREYYYDADAIKEPASVGWKGTDFIPASKKDLANDGIASAATGASSNGRTEDWFDTRNKRSVWTVSTKPYSGAHFATFPPDLIEPCILAGTSAHGCCAKCGAAWVRVTEPGERVQAHWQGTTQDKAKAAKGKHGATSVIETGSYQTYKTVGWQPTCLCNADVVPCTVLDPFTGSGTTGSVAVNHGRAFVGCELNPDYVELAYKRIAKTQLPLLEGIA